MKQVIMIHGLPDEEEFFDPLRESPSNCHWFPWIQRELSKKEVLSQSLEMPHPYNPDYRDHAAVLDQMVISPETILVGHSCGGGFLIKYFSQHPEKKPKKIILVAPWIDPENYLKELNPQSDFFDFTIDAHLTERTEVICFCSTDDEEYIIESVEKIHQALPKMIIHQFHDKRHFCESDLKTKAFPELLEEILKDTAVASS
jgi:predicted alpha/beta hydrolase family esterase